jgi:cellulose synthase/poly-beta-1,6-N-acetylglucosamine synthase-like glycosyltransferase
MGSVGSMLAQCYPYGDFRVAVVSDHMQAATNEQLGRLHIALLQPTFEKSSKAKALQHAIAYFEGHKKEEGEFDFVVILDADNVVDADFLERLNDVCAKGYKAIQCHRCAKNSENDIAVLDGVSEEINNTIFRKAHNRIGLSSALIGSGMCFDYRWFRSNVGNLSTAGEDRELEALLLRQRIYIHYEPEIHVYDEKVTNKDNFQRQRMRWMTAQVQSLLSLLPYLPHAIFTGNVDLVDKTIQQALIPRSMLIVLTFVFAVAVTLVVPVWGLKWWVLFVFICISLYVSTPRRLRSHSLLGKIATIPTLVGKMLANLLKMDRRNTDFIHTTHEG